MEGASFDGDVGRIDPSPSCSGELSAFELAQSLLEVAAEVAAVIEVDVGVPTGAVHAVVCLLGGELDRAGLHRNKIITSHPSNI